MSDEEAKSITFDDKMMADMVRGSKLLALVVRKAAGDAQKGDSRALSNPWDAVESVDGIIPPPLCPWALELMVETNTELPSSIAAMEVNVAGFGWRLKRLPGVTDGDKVEKEREDLHEFLTYADYDNQSFTSLRRSSRVDLETTGNWYWEVTRDRIGRPYGFRLLPSHTMRLTKIDRWPTKVDQVRPTGSGNDRSTKIIRRWRHFKRFVQASVTVASDEPELIYFKEYGDPRPLNWRTGEYGTKESPVHVDDLATDLLHFKIHSSRTPYGLPRWAGTILTVQGLRLAEEINFTTFQNNNIPSLAIMVSNGALTDATVDRLTKFMESNVQGDDSYSKIVVIEAVPSGDAEDGDSGQVRMTLEPLKGVQHTDELFQKYDENGRGKIRRTFRLPPIFSGDCHSADTEFLTGGGWKLYSDIGPRELVGTIDRSGALEFQAPMARHEYHFDGEMVRLKNRGIDALVTPNHRMWTRPTTAKKWAEKQWGFVEASELGSVKGGNAGYLEIPTAGACAGEHIDTFTIPRAAQKNAWDPSKPTKNPARDLARYNERAPRDVDASAFMKFLGYFVADGSTTASTRGYIVISKNVGAVADDIMETIRAIGFVPKTYNNRGTELAISFSHMGLWNWLRDNCGHDCTEKRLPRWALSASAAQLTVLLDCMVICDGHRPPRGSDGAFSYATTSEVLASQLHEICFRLGYTLTTRATPGHGKRSALWSSYAHIASRHLLHHMRDATPERYTGQVACFTVPNGLLVTKRNGRVMVSGNSASYERNTAETSRKLADEQVFNPERMDEDWVINRILVDMGALYHRFETNTPNVTNDKDLIEVMKVAEKTGAMTPALGRSMVEDIMGKDIGPVNESVNPDVPFSLTMAEAVKNLAQPNEPGQQVTALKSLRHLGLSEDWGDVIDLVELAKSRGGDAGGHDVVLNVGSQAGDIAAGTQAVYLSATALGLDGRELLIADGVVAKASVRFGVHSRLPLAAAAGAAGLEVSDVAKMFPGRAELWVLPIDARDKLTKEIAYTPQEGSVFGFVTGKE